MNTENNRALSKSSLPGGAIASSTIRTTGVFFVRLAAQAGSLLLLVRLLGASQFGMLAAVLATAVLLGSLSGLGANLFLLKETSIERRRRYEVLSYTVPSVLLAGALLLPLFIAIVVVGFDYPGQDVEAVLAIGIAELLVVPLLLLVAAEHQAQGRIALSQAVACLPVGVRLLTVLLVWLIKPEDALYLFLCFQLLGSIAAFAIALRSRRNAWPSFRSWRWPRRSEIRNASDFSLFNFLSLANNEIDKMLAVTLVPTTAAGIYSACNRIIGACVLPIAALVVSALPRLFRDKGLKGGLLKWMFISTCIYGLVALLIIRFSAPYLEMVLGNAFAGAGVVLANLSLAIPGMVLRISAGNTLMAIGMAKQRLLYELLGIVLMVILFVSLGRSFGIQGLVMGLTITEWILGFAGWSLIYGKSSRRS